MSIWELSDDGSGIFSILPWNLFGILVMNVYELSRMSNHFGGDFEYYVGFGGKIIRLL